MIIVLENGYVTFLRRITVLLIYNLDLILRASGWKRSALRSYQARENKFHIAKVLRLRARSIYISPSSLTGQSHRYSLYQSQNDIIEVVANYRLSRTQLDLLGNDKVQICDIVTTDACTTKHGLNSGNLIVNEAPYRRSERPFSLRHKGYFRRRQTACYNFG